jgi:RNA polymerase sigma-70 factor (ECF subfamily)
MMKTAERASAEAIFNVYVGMTSLIRAKLYRYVRNTADAEELSQEVLLRAWASACSGATDIRSPRALALKLSYNVAIDFIRHKKVVPIDLIADMDSLELLDERPQVEEILNSHQEIALLTRAMLGLGTKCRHVITLRKVYGLTQQEIAAHLGIAENTVEQHLGKGMRALAQALCF